MFSHRNIGLTAFVAAILLTGFALVKAQDKPAAPAANDVSGTWKWTAQGFGGDQETVLKLKQDGTKVTGTISGFNGEDMQIAEGMFKDGTLTFQTSNDFGGNKVLTKYTCTIANGALKGKSETIFAREFEGKRGQ